MQVREHDGLADRQGIGVSAELPGASDALAVVDVRKSFGHVEALRGVSLRVGRGEVVALVGDNGAGKSTLMKVMCGALTLDAGCVEYGGSLVDDAGVQAAAAAGVGVVYQDLALAPDLSVVSNLHLGHVRVRRGVLGRLGVLDREAMRAAATRSLRELGTDMIDVDATVAELSGGQRQAIAIARAVGWASSAVLLDEPTAALGVRQTAAVCDLIRSVAKRGLGVLLISHDMPRVLEVADRVAVMRHGVLAANLRAADTTIPEVVAAMLGYSGAEAAR